MKFAPEQKLAVKQALVPNIDSAVSIGSQIEAAVAAHHFKSLVRGVKDGERPVEMKTIDLKTPELQHAVLGKAINAVKAASVKPGEEVSGTTLESAISSIRSTIATLLSAAEPDQTTDASWAALNNLAAGLIAYEEFHDAQEAWHATRREKGKDAEGTKAALDKLNNLRLSDEQKEALVISFAAIARHGANLVHWLTINHHNDIAQQLHSAGVQLQDALLVKPERTEMPQSTTGFEIPITTQHTPTRSIPEEALGVA